MSDWGKYHIDRILEDAKHRLDQGDKEVILRILYLCFTIGVPTPAWLRKAYIAAYSKVATYEIKTWEEVFGRIAPEGRQTRAMNERLVKREQVYAFVQRRHASGHPIDREMFEIAAKEVCLRQRKGKRGGLSDPSSTAMDYYYEYKAIKDLWEKFDKDVVEKLRAGTETSPTDLIKALKPDIGRLGDAPRWFKPTKKNPRKS